jgi:hypothetical protein
MAEGVVVRPATGKSKTCAFPARSIPSSDRSTIQGPMTVRVHGGTDIAINDSFWRRAVLGTSGPIILLDSAFLPGNYS